MQEARSVREISKYLEGVDFTDVCPISHLDFLGAVSDGEQIVVLLPEKKWYIKKYLDGYITLKTMFGSRFILTPYAQLSMEIPVVRSEQINAYMNTEAVKIAFWGTMIGNVWYYFSKREVNFASVILDIIFVNLVALILYLMPLLPVLLRTSSAMPYQQLTEDDIANVLKLIADQEKNIPSESKDAKSTSPVNTEKSDLVVSRARGFFSAAASTLTLQDIHENMQKEGFVRQRHCSAP